MIVGSTSQILPVFIMDDQGNGLAGVLAATLSGQYSKAGGVAVSLAFSDGLNTAPYSSGTWAANGSAGNYLYHYPNAVFDTVGILQISIAATGAVETRISSDVELDWVRLGVDNTYTNTETNQGGNFDKVTVTNS